MKKRAYAREKIYRSATARRLRVSAAFTAFAAAVWLLTSVLSAVFWRSGAGRFLTVVSALACALFAAACALYAAELRKTLRIWKYCLFAVTETSSFECWGPVLAMNVTFRDESGALREGRSRFLFGARDVEAWQNVPIEIAYRPCGESPSDGGKKRLGEWVVVVGGAPKEKSRGNFSSKT